MGMSNKNSAHSDDLKFEVVKMCSGSESEKFSGIENDKENRIDQEKGHSVQDSKGRCSHSQQLQTNRGNEGHCRRGCSDPPQKNSTNLVVFNGSVFNKS